MLQPCETLSGLLSCSPGCPAQAFAVTWMLSPRRPWGQNAGFCQGSGMWWSQGSGGGGPSLAPCPAALQHVSV